MRNKRLEQVCRIMLALCMAVLLLTEFRVHGVRAADSAPRGLGPLVCDFGGSIAVDFLNAGVPPPHGLTAYSGTIAPGESARFQVYAVTFDNQAYFDVTDQFVPAVARQFRVKPGRVRVRPLRGGKDVSGSVRVRQGTDTVEIVYTPNRKARVERRALLTFELPCPFGQGFKVEFLLKIEGTDPTGSQNEVYP